ncbi:LicD family protein [Prevotella fusca]
MFFSTISRRIKEKIKYELGISQLIEQYESLYYILNNAIDITLLPKTKNVDLRWLQKCDAQLLAIFDRLCTKYNLTYWLDSGTLLGAVRHKGFIPWDDDIDICMLREEMNRVVPLMKAEVEKYGLTLFPTPLHPLRGLVLAYKPEETGIWMDIFPLDPYNSDEPESAVRKKVVEYRNFFYQHKEEPDIVLENKKKEIFPDNRFMKKHYLLATLESWKGCKWICIHEEKDIFPVQRMEFEGYHLCVPANQDDYLQHWYGSNYMDFPRLSINTHGAKKNQLKMCEKAKAHGISLEEVYNYLVKVYNQLEVG